MHQEHCADLLEGPRVDLAHVLAGVGQLLPAFAPVRHEPSCAGHVVHVLRFHFQGVRDAR